MTKLGVHVSAGNRRGFGEYLKLAADADSPVPVVMAVDQDAWPDVLRYSPGTLVVYRHQPKDKHGEGLDGPPDVYQGDPVACARRWMASLLPNWRRNTAHYYAPINEQDPATLEQFDWLNAFTLECLMVADENAVKLALYAFSAGNPKRLLGPEGEVLAEPADCWRRLVSSLHYARLRGHVLLLHEYGLSSPAANGGPASSLRASAPHLALRYRDAYRVLNAYGATPKLIVSEASAGTGARPAWGSLSREQWLDDAAWYDRELMRDAAVIGCCLYQAGGAEDLSELFPWLSRYAATTPTPDPEADPVVGLTPVEARYVMRTEPITAHQVAQVQTYLTSVGITAVVGRA